MKVVIGFLAILAPTFAEHIQVKFSPEATKVAFTLGATGHTVHGTFQLASGEMWFDPGSGIAGGQLIANAGSGETGSNGRDSRMKKNVLKVNMYPQIVFTPDHINGKVNESGDSEFQVHGLLHIHGGTHEITMNVKAHVNKDQLTTTAAFDVPYVEWGIPNPSNFLLKVKDTVNISVDGHGQIDFRASSSAR